MIISLRIFLSLLLGLLVLIGSSHVFAGRSFFLQRDDYKVGGGRRRNLQQTFDNVVGGQGNETEFFVEDCLNFLLSKPVLEDGSITNIEFTSFLVEYCNHNTQGMCDGRSHQWQPSSSTAVTYFSLNGNLRFRFFSAACPFHTPQGADCLLNFNMAEFGITVANNSTQERNTIRSLCVDSHTILTEEGLIDPLYISSEIHPSSAPSSMSTPTPPPSTRQPQYDGDMTNNEQNKNSRQRETRFTTPAILGIVSVVWAFAFCVAVLFSGGWSEKPYDMNGPVETTTTTTTERRTSQDHGLPKTSSPDTGDTSDSPDTREDDEAKLDSSDDKKIEVAASP